LSTQAYDRRAGWVTFAAIVMFAVGFGRIISAIAYFDNSTDVANLTQGLFGGSLWAWGIWDLCISALALLGGWSLLSNGGYGRVVGYVWGVVVLVNGFLILGAAPWYAAVAITLATLVIYGLATSSPSEA
jgi:hypothetical protein